MERPPKGNVAVAYPRSPFSQTPSNCYLTVNNSKKAAGSQVQLAIGSNSRWRPLDHNMKILKQLRINH